MSIIKESIFSKEREEPVIDKSSFHSLSYGMYVIGTRFEGSEFRLRLEHLRSGHVLAVAGERRLE